MSLIQKYIWVIKTIHRSGRITLKDLNEKWRENIDLSRGENLPRQTFDRWKGGILDMFGIVIDCERNGRYRYYIANPEVLAKENCVHGFLIPTARLKLCQAVYLSMIEY